MAAAESVAMQRLLLPSAQTRRRIERAREKNWGERSRVPEASLVVIDECAVSESAAVLRAYAGAAIILHQRHEPLHHILRRIARRVQSLRRDGMRVKEAHFLSAGVRLTAHHEKIAELLFDSLQGPKATLHLLTPCAKNETRHELFALAGGFLERSDHAKSVRIGFPCDPSRPSNQEVNPACALETDA